MRRKGFFAAAALTALTQAAAQPAVAEERLRLGLREDAPPFSSRVEGAPADAAFDAAYAGFSVSLCSRVVDTLKRRQPALAVEHVGITAMTRFPDGDNQGETWDLLCDPTSITQARLDWCAFSFPFFVTGIAYAARDPSATAESLGGQPVALVGETTADTGLKSDWESRYGSAPRFERVEDYKTAVAAMEAGKVAAVFGDQVLLQEALAEAKLDMEVSADVLSIELYGFCVAPDRPDVLAAVNATLAELYRSGEVYRLLSRDFDGRGATRLLSNLYTLYAVAEE